MAILEVLHFPDTRLRTKAKAVAQVDDNIRRLVRDMFKTMYAAPGIGLAATQVNVHLRVITIDISDDRGAPVCLINPEILEAEGKAQIEEGCLSVPGIFEPVKRAARIKARWLDEQGRDIERELDGLLSICVQHEMDHLEGKLFVDYLSALKRQRIREKLEKQRRQVL